MECLNLIDGAMRSPGRGAWLEVQEPATGGVIGRCAASDEIDVDRAVDAARRAFPEWSAASAADRADRLDRLAAIIERDAEAFALAESTDTGKPLSIARSVDVPRGVANLRFFADLVRGWSEPPFELTIASGGPARQPAAAGSHSRPQETGLLHPRPFASMHSVVQRPASGVAACISPWNLPIYLLTWKIAPALAAGCTVVAKPSEVTPMSATMLAERAIEAGFPAGVLNVVHGRGSDAGAALVAHEGVTAITFTGGTATGAAIARVAAPRFKRLSLELGGKNAAIVCADADLDVALPGVLRSAFLNQGQICLCGSRILIERGIYERFRDALLERVRALRVGDPLDSETEQGAVTSREHLLKIERAVAQAVELGGRVLCGGARVERASLPARCADGCFWSPTLLEGLSPSCATNQEEIFGPVATLIPFEGDSEAVEIANGVRYGLAASVWSGNSARAEELASHLHAGTVWINCWLVRDLRVPFGGWKESGVGREGGFDALRFFTESRTVVQTR